MYESNITINSIVWDRMGEKLLIAADDGIIHEVTVSHTSHARVLTNLEWM